MLVLCRTNLGPQCQNKLDIHFASFLYSQEQKRAETRYHELRQSCLEHEQVLSAGNLQALTIRVDEIERLALTRAGCNPSQDMANVHDELQRLKRRIDIVSTNVLGDTTNAENDQHCARDLITR